MKRWASRGVFHTLVFSLVHRGEGNEIQSARSTARGCTKQNEKPRRQSVQRHWDGKNTVYLRNEQLLLTVFGGQGQGRRQGKAGWRGLAFFLPFLEMHAPFPPFLHFAKQNPSFPNTKPGLEEAPS